MTSEEILAEHPDLTREDIHESLLYTAEAVREPLAAAGSKLDRMRP